jgi:hypothetical protein
MNLLNAFLRGMARLLYPFDRTEITKIRKRSDLAALKSDWDAVGKDMWTAIEKYDKEMK